MSNADRVRQVLGWLSFTGQRSLSLITLYLDDVDYASHEFGPDAPETDSAIARVDSAVGALVSGIKARGLEDRVNVVVVSDHGMARVDPRKVVYLDDFIGPDSIDLIDGGPFVSLAPVGVSVEELYRRLSRAHPRLTIYKKSEVPAAYHYRNHPRIPPIIGTLSEGWTATTRRAAADRERVSLGEHGYPPDRESMRAIFLADGPAFRDGVVAEPFQNIHIYALLAHVLGLKPAPNDGRLDSVRVMLSAPDRECLVSPLFHQLPAPEDQDPIRHPHRREAIEIADFSRVRLSGCAPRRSSAARPSRAPVFPDDRRSPGRALDLVP